MNWISKIWIVPIILALVLSGCSTKIDVDNNLIENKTDVDGDDTDVGNGQTFCTLDAKICSDGSAVGRDPNNGCAFFPCPDEGNNGGTKIAAEFRNYAANSVEQCAATTFICDIPGTKAFFDQSGCGCEATEPKKYTTEDLDECQLIRYMCEENYVPFTDEVGCGCKFSWDLALENRYPDSPEENAIQCTDEQRGDVACTMEYNPVCGWFGQNIQCIDYPCAATYGNGCTACSDENVEYYTEGLCPE
ncbi:MAG TPA: hypothetical protein VEC16_02515 [Alphaproteobacteria bacterium]|nr:hypothetical protein [Alphaproteobacteria bacterium]